MDPPVREGALPGSLGLERVRVHAPMLRLSEAVAAQLSTAIAADVPVLVQWVNSEEIRLHVLRAISLYKYRGSQQ